MDRAPLRRLLDEHEDRQLSPSTGWSRRSWTALADELLLGARAFASPQHAGVRFPGPTGGYGARVDLLEGFARTFLAAGFRVAGEGGDDPEGYLEWYARGLAAGVDPESPERWVRLDEHHQSKVEAASIALVLHLTKPWLWDLLPSLVQEQVVDYLTPAVGSSYPPINWLWFQIVVEQFLANIGAPHSRDDIASALGVLDGFVREDGWVSDGPERSFDHYGGWALHFYPHLWMEMAAGDPLAEERRAGYRARTGRFLEDAVRLVGADGSPLLQGRSLAYRFAAAAPFWSAARAGIDTVPAGLLRRAASGIARHFVDAGAPDSTGVLTMGWHGVFPRIGQDYSGPGSPYWASKGLLGLSLPADHPVWTAVEEELPAEAADQDFVVAAAGWLVSSRRSDGIVRVVNHGTDHSVAETELRDSPLYARLGYSTATSPLLAGPGLDQPLDQAVVLLDRGGRATSRTGFHRGAVRRLPSGTLSGSSWGRAAWVEPQGDEPDHGFGRRGEVRRGPVLEVVSFVRHGWELRAVRIAADAAETEEPVALRVGGWAVSSPGSLGSWVVDLGGLPVAGETGVPNSTPLAAVAVVPWVMTGGSPEPERWYLCAVGVGDAGFDACAPSPSGFAARDDGAATMRVRWEDGTEDEVGLPPSCSAPGRSASV